MTDPEGRVTSEPEFFAFDAAIAELERRARQLATRVRTETGVDATAARSITSAPGWSPLAREAYWELRELEGRLATLRSRRMSLQLGAFKRALDDDAVMTPALRRWWLERY